MAQKCTTTWWEKLFSRSFRVESGPEVIESQTREWLQQENADAACRNKINGACINNAWISGLCSKDQLFASSESRLLQVCLCMNGEPGQYKSVEEK